MPEMPFKLAGMFLSAGLLAAGLAGPAYPADVSTTVQSGSAPAKAAVTTPAGRSGVASNEADIVFPPPPDKPRIRYLYSLARYQDMGFPERGFFGKILDFFTGKKIPEGWALVRPYGVCAVGDRVYVADTEGSAVVVFNRVKKTITRFGGKLAGRLVAPIGIASDGRETVFVTDSNQKLVMAYDLEGNFLFQCSPTGDFDRPTGLAWDAARNRLLVVDSGRKMVFAYGLDGIKKAEYPVEGDMAGGLVNPVNIALGPGGEMFITDPIICGVSVFSPEGKFLRKWGECGDMAGYFARPRGVALDSEGNVYVADALFHAVQIFDPAGKLLLFFGADGSEPGAFHLPAGIFIDPQDRVYVVDSGNNRVQVFQYIKTR